MLQFGDLPIMFSLQFGFHFRFSFFDHRLVITAHPLHLFTTFTALLPARLLAVRLLAVRLLAGVRWLAMTSRSSYLDSAVQLRRPSSECLRA